MCQGGGVSTENHINWHVQAGRKTLACKLTICFNLLRHPETSQVDKECTNSVHSIPLPKWVLMLSALLLHLFTPLYLHTSIRWSVKKGAKVGNQWPLLVDLGCLETKTNISKNLKAGWAWHATIYPTRAKGLLLSTRGPKLDQHATKSTYPQSVWWPQSVCDAKSFTAVVYRKWMLLFFSSSCPYQ